jgi:hypothetical protein
VTAPRFARVTDPYGIADRLLCRRAAPRDRQPRPGRQRGRGSGHDRYGRQTRPRRRTRRRSPDRRARQADGRLRAESGSSRLSSVLLAANATAGPPGSRRSTVLLSVECQLIGKAAPNRGVVVLGRFLCLGAETSPRVVRQVGVVVDHPPRLLAVVGLQGGERAGPRLQAARLLDECLSSRPIFRPRAVWRSSAWSGISRRGTLSLSSCQTAQSTRPTSARSPARSARGRRTEVVASRGREVRVRRTRPPYPEEFRREAIKRCDRPRPPVCARSRKLRGRSDGFESLVDGREYAELDALSSP